ncbi:MAG: rhomboid family intramembrane serine protease [Hyphomicrobiales bacterium]|nr:rhomboid family intramembrane serine protease [Hyphomicrobiales bacterium]
MTPSEPRAPRQREPMFNVPGVIIIVIALMLLIYAAGLLLSNQGEADLIKRFAFEPGRLTYFFAPETMRSVIAGLQTQGRQGGDEAALAQFLIGSGRLQPWTFLTYAFLHGSWLHVGSNCLWLLVFGAPVARRFGAARFLLLLAVTAIAGASMHYAFNATSIAPVIGASAAVAGAMGAAVRFVFQPGGLSPQSGYVPALSLGEVMRSSSALSFLVVWFVVNLVTGVGSGALAISSGPIAWQAHIGGLLAGLLLFNLFDRPQTELQPSLARAPEQAHPES